jgi:hypothetical protein
MAKMSGKAAIVSVDNSAGAPQVISSDVKGYTIEYNVDPLEVTGFGDGSKNYTPGLLVTGITLVVMWNTAATTGAYTVLKGIVGAAASKTVSVTPEGSGIAYSGEFMLDGISPQSSPDGIIELGSVHFSVMGSVAPTMA